MNRVQTEEEFEEWWDRLLFDFDTPGLRVWRNIARRMRGLPPFKPHWRVQLESWLAARSSHAARARP